MYYVRYGPNDTDDRYLWNWYGPDITSYTAASGVAGGDFDIADVELLSPDPGATVTLPETFTWRRRELLRRTPIAGGCSIPPAPTPGGATIWETWAASR